MPIKLGYIQDTQLFVEEDGILKPLGLISNGELTPISISDFECDIDKEAVDWRGIFKSEPVEFTMIAKNKLKALWIFVTTGNDLYLKFPKKLRRRRNR